MFVLLARLISFIFNPVLLLIPAPYLLVIRETGNASLALEWTLISFVFVLLTGAFIGVGVKKGYFSDFDVSKREQRPLLFLLVSVIGILYFISLIYFNAPFVLFILLACILISILLFSFINTRIKASIHIGTACALIISLAFLYGPLYLLLLVLIPLIGWSRFKIKRHTVKEMVVGGSLGISLTVVLYIIIKVIEQIW